MAAGAKRLRKNSNQSISDESDDYDDHENYEWRKRKSVIQVDSNFRYNARPKVFSKNALLARENRVRKKMYVENLENDLKRFRNENQQLKVEMSRKNVHITNLKHEVQYLKNVISNTKEIEALLHSINRTTGLKTTSSMASHRKTPQRHPWEDHIDDCYEDDALTKYLIDTDGSEPNFSQDLALSTSLDIFDPLPPLPVNVNRSESEQTDHNYSSIDSGDTVNPDNFGICLHVSKAKVSLEFCSQCSQKASDAWNKEFD